LKIPILKLGDILLTSMPEDLTDEDALEFQNAVLEKINKTESNGIAIDVTALETVDSFMARVINDTAKMAKLLGTEVILCGINPQVALTLVEMGRELIGVKTALNLEQGVTELRKLIDAGNSIPE